MSVEDRRTIAPAVLELLEDRVFGRDWRRRFLGHPRARIFIHHDHLAILYPDGRLRIRGPR